MNKQAISYWTATALAAFVFGAGGALDVLGAPSVVATIEHLGYPAYFARILGFWKILGALAILTPARPRLKEWAYAGMFFNMSGAAASHLFLGDSAGEVLKPLAILALVVASWALRPAGRTALGVRIEGSPQRAANGG